MASIFSPVRLAGGNFQVLLLLRRLTFSLDVLKIILQMYEIGDLVDNFDKLK